MASQLDGLVKAIAKELAAELRPLLNTQPASAEARLLPMREAAAYLSRSQSSVRAMIASGEIPEPVVKRLGGRVYLDRVELDKWLTER